MDVCFRVFRGLDLNDQVYRRDIEATRSDIGGHKHLKLLLLESLQSYLSLVLGYVAMHNFDLVLYFFGQQQLVGLDFC